ncbi:sulfatase family protein [Segetibacter aerophilus]|uniref:Heparan N-sulfatase n=1 Tax=Segetibacter aerophilus TaxID=670293 RepID=A0A512B745_9BACT|nr:sulfatase [Segetibacter aerophilus]GEO07768.1 heparan N-sulfatase [Segetibacter aerophilus]
MSGTSLQAFLTIILSAFLVNVSDARPGKQSRPNIILIVSDDHGREAVGCYGNKVVKTPNIDRLASEGTRFSNAFCTVSSCSPSRSAILTGMQSHSNGMYGLEHQEHHFSSFDKILSLPVLLEKAGYRTARIGKLHVAPEPVYHFQKVLQEGAVNNPASIGRSPVEMADLCSPVFSESSEQPFFLYYATDDPHRSNSVLANGTPFFDGSRPNAFGNRTQAYPMVVENTFNPANVVVPSFLPDTRACREELAQYYQAISRMDQGVGRLISNLKAAGKYEQTVIIYISDNGSPFPGSKTNLYEPGMRLPCIVKLPNASRKNFVNDAMISWVDITPTILDFADFTGSIKQFQGRSFKNIIEQETVKGWDEVYASHSFHEVMMYYPMRVLRERRYKLIYNIAWKLQYPMALDLYQSYTWQSITKTKSGKLGQRTVQSYLQRPKFELYDLDKDPNELNNLADNVGYKHELKRMQDKLRHFQERTHDMWLSKWNYE